MESVHDTRILYSSTLYHLKGLSHTLALPCACSTPHSSPIGLEGGGRSMRGVSKVLAVFSSGMMQRLEAGEAITGVRGPDLIVGIETERLANACAFASRTSAREGLGFM